MWLLCVTATVHNPFMLQWTLQNDAIINLFTQSVLMHDITTIQEHPYVLYTRTIMPTMTDTQ